METKPANLPPQPKRTGPDPDQTGLTAVDLGLIDYRAAWDTQLHHHQLVAEGAPPRILLLEHNPVFTMGRRGEISGVPNLIVSQEVIRQRGIEFVQTDRGGDITYHGHGQLIAYPILKLLYYRLSVGAYMKLLQDVVITLLNSLGLTATTDDAGIGVWVPSNSPGGPPEKICAMGVRVKRGVTLHGLALNVTTDLAPFDMIIPCGIPGRRVTSLKAKLGDNCPSMEATKYLLVKHFSEKIGRSRAS